MFSGACPARPETRHLIGSHSWRVVALDVRPGCGPNWRAVPGRFRSVSDWFPAGSGRDRVAMPTRRKSNALKLLTGNPGRRAVVESPEASSPLSVQLPPELLTDERAAAEWRRTIVPAIDAGQLVATDRALVVMHCQLWARVQQLHERRDVGADVGRAVALLLRVDAELGFTPASRSKVGPAGGATKLRRNNPLSKYLD